MTIPHGKRPTEAIQLPTKLVCESYFKTEDPLVTVAVASYEARRDRIKELLQSIASQPYHNVEVVIVDSSDLEFLAKTADKTSWVRHIPSDPRGVAAGFNEAIAHSKGDIIAIVADDDFFTEKRLIEPIKKIKQGSDIVYGDVYDLDEDTQKKSYRKALEVDDTDELWLELFRFDGFKGSIPAATVTFRAECVKEETFNEELAGGEDYHLWVRLFKKFEPAYISKPLAVMRQHDESLSSDPDMMYENRLRAIELLCERFPKLRQYQQERELLERYDYARHLMFNDRVSEAQSIFVELLLQERYYRAAVMALICLLPAEHERAVRILDRLYSSIQ